MGSLSFSSVLLLDRDQVLNQDQESSFDCLENYLFLTFLTDSNKLIPALRNCYSITFHERSKMRILSILLIVLISIVYHVHAESYENVDPTEQKRRFGIVSAETTRLRSWTC